MKIALIICGVLLALAIAAIAVLILAVRSAANVAADVLKASWRR